MAGTRLYGPVLNPANTRKVSLLSQETSQDELTFSGKTITGRLSAGAPIIGLLMTLYVEASGQGATTNNITSLIGGLARSIGQVQIKGDNDPIIDTEFRDLVAVHEGCNLKNPVLQTGTSGSNVYAKYTLYVPFDMGNLRSCLDPQAYNNVTYKFREAASFASVWATDSLADAWIQLTTVESGGHNLMEEGGNGYPYLQRRWIAEAFTTPQIGENRFRLTRGLWFDALIIEATHTNGTEAEAIIDEIEIQIGSTPRFRWKRELAKALENATNFSSATLRNGILHIPFKLSDYHDQIMSTETAQDITLVVRCGSTTVSTDNLRVIQGQIVGGPDKIGGVITQAKV